MTPSAPSRAIRPLTPSRGDLPATDPSLPPSPHRNGAPAVPEFEESLRRASAREGWRKVLRRMPAAQTAEMTMFDFHPDSDIETPTPSDLLTEAGLDPRAIREILAGPDGEAE